MAKATKIRSYQVCAERVCAEHVGGPFWIVWAS